MDCKWTLIILIMKINSNYTTLRKLTRICYKSISNCYNNCNPWNPQRLVYFFTCLHQSAIEVTMHWTHNEPLHCDSYASLHRHNRCMGSCNQRQILLHNCLACLAMFAYVTQCELVLNRWSIRIMLNVPSSIWFDYITLYLIWLAYLKLFFVLLQNLLCVASEKHCLNLYVFCVFCLNTCFSCFYFASA